VSELIADGLGLTSAVACALGVAGCASKAASVVDDHRIHIFRQAVSPRWAYRILGLLMLITLYNAIHYT